MLWQNCFYSVFLFSVESFVHSQSLRMPMCLNSKLNDDTCWCIYTDIDITEQLQPVHCAGRSVCMKAFVTPHWQTCSALIMGFLCSTNFTHHQNSKKVLSVFSICWQSRQKFMSVFQRKFTASSKWPDICLRSGDTTLSQPKEPKEEIVWCC